jgi:hypothetical protein
MLVDSAVDTGHQIHRGGSDSGQSVFKIGIRDEALDKSGSR